MPMTYFPVAVQKVAAWLPFQHIAFTPLQIYLGKLSGMDAVESAGHAVAMDCCVAAQLGDVWWRAATLKITIHGG